MTQSKPDFATLTARHAASTDEARAPFLSRRSLLRAGLGVSLLGLGLRQASAAATLEQFLTYNIQPEEWLAQVFAGAAIPAPGVANSAPPGLMQAGPQRTRYWRANGRTAWIFDDIAKVGYAPVTAGFVIKADAIESAKVLVYRESRGDQIGRPSFLSEFAGARAAGNGVDKKIDNIAGATYSVNMMVRMARAALAIDATVK